MITNPKAEQTIEEIIESLDIDTDDYTFVEIDDSNENKYIKDLYKYSKTKQKRIFVKKGVYAMSTKKIESLIRLAEIQNYYINNPVRFINDMFNVELLDAQAYIVQMSWNCPNVLLVCSRG